MAALCAVFLTAGATGCGGDDRAAPKAPDRELVAWTKAKRADTIAGYRDYLAVYARGAHSRAAKKTIAALKKDDAPFRAAVAEGTRAAVRRFLEQFPGHRREAPARKLLGLLEARAKERSRDASGRNIVDLIAERKVRATASGGDITTVGVDVKSLVKHRIKVKIPAGTFFAAGGGAVQNMVATEPATIELEAESDDGTPVSVACANRTLHIPGAGDRFTIQRRPPQPGLSRLISALRQANASYPVQQAAVWIITDGASYADLGTLQDESGQRVITKSDYDRATRIVRRAGLS